MLLTILKWLFQIPSRETDRGSNRRHTVGQSIPSVLPKHDGSKAEGITKTAANSGIGDEEMRQRLREEIQRKRCEQEEWRQAALRAAEEEEQPLSWHKAYDEYRRTAEWDCVRQRVLRKASFACVMCGGKAVAAHHTKYPPGYGPSLTQFIVNEDESLIVAICNECHLAVHNRLANDAKLSSSSDHQREGRCSPRPDSDIRQAAGKATAESLKTSLPPCPSGFVVSTRASGSIAFGDGRLLAPLEFSHVATAAITSQKGGCRVDEYYLLPEGGHWLICRAFPSVDVGEVFPLNKEWEPYAWAPRGQETAHAASIHLLLAAWKEEGLIEGPTLVTPGLCTRRDFALVIKALRQRPARKRVRKCNRRKSNRRDSRGDK